MVRVAAVGGYQAKVTLIGGPEMLALDGAERAGDTWRPARVEMAQPLAAALDAALSTLKPTPSALHLLLVESLPPNDVSRVEPAQVAHLGQQDSSRLGRM